ncbi:MAG: hypothetical protein MUD00_00065 [Candidatus Pacebacteria bacterium]|jgi:F0F1-type ATP synthase epsilon subunit|nr:hypothetical protein [Candidatus Paceibacterota bacterium]
MDKKPLSIILQTPEKTLFSGAALSATVQTEEGFLELLDHHATLVGSILSSKITIRRDADTREEFLVRDAFVTCNNIENSITILALWGEVLEKVNTKTVEEYFAFLKKELLSSENLTPYQLRYVEEQKQSSEQLIDLINTESRG